MKNIRTFVAILLAVAFAAAVNGQTVVRSLDTTNPNKPKEEQKQTQTQNNDNQNVVTNETNPNQHLERQSEQQNYHDRFSFWGFAAGYVYEFPVYDGKAGDGMSGMRIPFHFNYVFKTAPVGIYGLIGYEFNKASIEANVVSSSYKTTIDYTVHRIPILAHISYNLGNERLGVILHGGPGLNILAGGQSKYMNDAKKKTYKKESIESGCDFTLGLGAGLVIKKTIIIHFGFNGAVTGDGVHQCDLDASVMFAF